MYIHLCKLCDKKKKLIKSHIIPYSCFSEGTRILTNGNQYPKRRPIGSYDPKILCGDCDNFLNTKYDNDAKTILIDRKGVIEKKVHDPHTGRSLSYYILNEKNNYDVIAKFFISVLWRASVSTLEDFADFSLGPYENIAKKALIDTKNDDWRKYFSVCLCCFKDFNALIHLVPFKFTRIDGVNAYSLILAGIKAFVRVDKRYLPGGLKPIELSKFNNLLMIQTRISNIREYKLLLDMANKLSKHDYA